MVLSKEEIQAQLKNKNLKQIDRELETISYFTLVSLAKGKGNPKYETLRIMTEYLSR